MTKNVLIVVAALTVMAAIPLAAAGHSTKLTVTSTLTGKQRLPHRIRWVAFPKPTANAARVEFMIDGKVRWIETEAPYVYGDDTDWLVTSWLPAGRHRFAVRATSAEGERAVSTVVASVPAPPSGPKALANTRWTRVFSKSEVGDAPAGTWKLTITKAGWKIKDPEGGGNFIDVAYLSAGTLETRGGIWTRPRAQQEPSVQEGNGWCEDTNESVRFKWAVNGRKLTLILAGPKRCEGLGSFLSAGPWISAR